MRAALPGASCSSRCRLDGGRRAHFGQRKETFFYGGSRAGRSALPLAPLHGPDTRQGALSARPSLWPWEQQSNAAGVTPQVLADLCAANSSRTAVPDAGWSRLWSRKAPDRRARKAAWRGRRRRRSWRGCVRPTLRLVPRGGRRAAARIMRRRCGRVVRAVPASSSGTCGWDPVFGRRDVLLAVAAAARRRRRRRHHHRRRLHADYLCDADALRRLVGATARPTTCGSSCSCAADGAFSSGCTWR